MRYDNATVNPDPPAKVSQKFAQCRVLMARRWRFMRAGEAVVRNMCCSIPQLCVHAVMAPYSASFHTLSLSRRFVTRFHCVVFRANSTAQPCRSLRRVLLSFTSLLFHWSVSPAAVCPAWCVPIALLALCIYSLYMFHYQSASLRRRAALLAQHFFIVLLLSFPGLSAAQQESTPPKKSPP